MDLLSICLSDVPKDRFKKADNGKVYLNLITGERKEPDKFDNNLWVAVSQTKEEREAKMDKIYVGAGVRKEFAPSSPVRPEQVESLPPAMDDLPWD
jgi:hypothetical protein